MAPGIELVGPTACKVRVARGRTSAPAGRLRRISSGPLAKVSELSHVQVHCGLMVFTRVLRIIALIQRRESQTQALSDFP